MHPIRTQPHSISEPYMYPQSQSIGILLCVVLYNTVSFHRRIPWEHYRCLSRQPLSHTCCNTSVLQSILCLVTNGQFNALVLAGFDLSVCLCFWWIARLQNCSHLMYTLHKSETRITDNNRKWKTKSLHFITLTYRKKVFATFLWSVVSKYKTSQYTYCRYAVKKYFHRLPTTVSHFLSSSSWCLFSGDVCKISFYWSDAQLEGFVCWYGWRGEGIGCLWLIIYCWYGMIVAHQYVILSYMYVSLEI